MPNNTKPSDFWNFNLPPDIDRLLSEAHSNTSAPDDKNNFDSVPPAPFSGFLSGLEKSTAFALNDESIAALESLYKSKTPTSIVELLSDIRDHVRGASSPDFKVNTTTARQVPSINNARLKFLSVDDKEIDVQILDSCVLYVDMRDSSKMSANYDAEVLPRLYAPYLKAMIEASSQYGGEVKGIVGDRIMVVFPPGECCTAAVNTAILFNTVADRILGREISNFRCGIGVDRGKMLVAKVGSVRHGSARLENQSLVWLGTCANVASKLTDAANKDSQPEPLKVYQKYTSLTSGKTDERIVTAEEFVVTAESIARYGASAGERFHVEFMALAQTPQRRVAPVLITENVLRGLKAESPDHETLLKNYWDVQSGVSAPGYEGQIFGGDLYLTAVETI